MITVLALLLCQPATACQQDPCSLIQAIPNAISVFFNPAAGDAMMDAAVNDIILKLGRKAELLKSRAIGTQRAFDGDSSKARRCWQAGAATVALGAGLDRPGLSIAPALTTGVAMDEESAANSSSAAPGDALVVEAVLKPLGAAPSAWSGIALVAMGAEAGEGAGEEGANASETV